MRSWLAGWDSWAYEAGWAPRQLEALEPWEVRLVAEAAQRKEKREWDRTAWLASLLLNAWAGKGKRVTPQDLLGRGFVGAEKVRKMTRTEAEAERRAILDRLAVVGETWPKKN